MNVEPLAEVTEQDIRRFEEEGVVCLRGMFDRDWIERMRAAIERNLANAGTLAIEYAEGKSPGRFLGDMFMWMRDEDFHAFVFDSPAARIAQKIMRSQKVNFFYDHLFVKEPGTLVPTPWHQDQPYWPVQGSQICSVWLALDRVSKESSGMEYVKGSHKWGKWYKPRGFDGKDRYPEARGETIPDIDADRDKYAFVNGDMEPGDCLIHQALTIHGSGGNVTNHTRRRALATRWTGDDATYDARPGTFQKIREPGLRTGDPMDCDLFPRIAV